MMIMIMYINTKSIVIPYSKTLVVKSLVKWLLQRIGKKNLHQQSLDTLEC